MNAFPGCVDVQLKVDIFQPGVFFTISIWESEAALNIYRDSALFRETWKKVKPHFRSKAQAWSLS
ncbi:MAG: hypothetical protein EOO00_09145 [Chitinophagaceae bacterium]|nr:MAG: hypothetical protein EOO00_09145 [Chitinophagaceae bacterium]